MACEYVCCVDRLSTKVILREHYMWAYETAFCFQMPQALGGNGNYNIFSNHNIYKHECEKYYKHMKYFKICYWNKQSLSE